jgi:hypothetical protein
MTAIDGQFVGVDEVRSACHPHNSRVLMHHRRLLNLLCRIPRKSVRHNLSLTVRRTSTANSITLSCFGKFAKMTLNETFAADHDETFFALLIVLPFSVAL